MGKKAMRQTCIALLLGSCAHWHEPMRLPSKGGPPWVEYNTRHFRLQTDLDVEPARKLAIQMEQRRSGLISAAWHGATFEGPRTRVVAFRNSSELQTFLRRGVAGIWTLDTAGEKLMVLAASFTDQRADLAGYGIQVFTHELAHDLASSYFARQPRWLSEGLSVMEERRARPQRSCPICSGTTGLGAAAPLVGRRHWGEESVGEGASEGRNERTNPPEVRNTEYPLLRDRNLTCESVCP